VPTFLTIANVKHATRLALSRWTLISFKRAYLFCTWGADGAAAVDVQTQHRNIMQSNAYLAEGKKVVEYVHIYEPQRATDSYFLGQSTVGAGDSFIAGALYGLFYRSGWDLATTLGFANEVAGRKIAQEGFSGLAEGMDSWF
jgi:ketohexokinase